MEYNTQQRKLPLPEYGRSVQHMVDHALTIEDREERQRCARTIVNIMGGMFPALRDSADFNRRLWDHLAIMSDFQLDIDYPVEVVKRESFLLCHFCPSLLYAPFQGIFLELFADHPAAPAAPGLAARTLTYEISASSRYLYPLSAMWLLRPWRSSPRSRSKK